MCVQVAGQSDRDPNTCPRSSPQDASLYFSNCAKEEAVGMARKRGHSARLVSVQKEEISGFRLQRKTIFSGSTPSICNAFATERNDEPLSPGPSSAITNVSADRFRSAIHSRCSFENRHSLRNGCPCGRTVVRDAA